MTSTVVSLLLAAAITLLISTAINRRRRDRKARETRRAEWGQWREIDRDMAAIDLYTRARVNAGQAPCPTIDDRTWADLTMDDVFRVLDRAESRAGQQLLYQRLRASPVSSHLEAFEALVTTFSTDQAAREDAQAALAAMRNADAYDIWWLTQPGTFESRPALLIFPVLTAAMLAILVLLPFAPAALVLLIAGIIAGLLLRATLLSRANMLLTPFGHVASLTAAATRLRTVVRPDNTALTGPLESDLPHLASLRRVAAWTGRNSASSSDLGSFVIEYLNLLLCLDGNAALLGARELRARSAELLRVVDAVGNIDAALSIASYRAGTAGWTRPVHVPASAPAVLSDMRHPLLPDAVPNSVSLALPHGMLITGSNMSGKTTFLRTLGVTVVMAQTVNTCLAARYEAPTFVVRSCIGRADDPSTGKSYYLVEVEAVLDLVRAAETDVAHLMLFDELFRGTNTVERIAAGEAVLVFLLDTGKPHVVVAATHDQELVDLLDGRYAPFHFSDAVDDAGLTFDYRLRPGPATTWNAISLLRLRGAPPELVRRAMARAQSVLAQRAGVSAGLRA